MGNVYSEKCITILEKALLPIFSVEVLSKSLTLFMEDDAPCHTAKKTKKWEVKHDIRKLLWPNLSSDMNPIENVWAVFDRAVRKCP